MRHHPSLPKARRRGRRSRLLAVLAALMLCASSTALLAQEAEAAQESEDSLEERLWDAARDGDADAIGALLEAGAEADAEFRDGATALFYAAQRGHAPVVARLLEAGASPHAKSTMLQITALHVSAGFPEVVKLLVDAGADVSARDLQSNQSPLAWSVMRRCEPCMAAMLTGGPSPEALQGAMLFAQRMQQPQLMEPLKQALGSVDASPRWPQFRGVRGSGIADGSRAPASWNADEGKGLAWSTEIPGHGHSSPSVWGDKIFLTTAIGGTVQVQRFAVTPMDVSDDSSEHTFEVLAISRSSGEILWRQVAHTGVPRNQRHLKNSFATETPATDGKYVVASFGSHGLYCYTVDGELLWSQDAGTFDTGFFSDPGYQWGTASSPILVDDTVVVQVDLQEDSYIAAFDLETGEERWRTSRDELPSWGTPVLYDGPEGPALATNGVNALRGYDARTGEVLWTLNTGNSMIPGSSPVVGLDLIFIGNGYRPLKPIYAIRTDAEGDISLGASEDSNADVAWSHKKGGPYYTSPLVYQDILYILADNGIFSAYQAQSGERIYRQRIGNGRTTFAASPIAADGKIYLASETGDVFVIRAGLDFELLATNPSGGPILSTPALVDGTVLVRTQNHLQAFHTPPAPRPQAQPSK
ncbi:MAG: PQQ-binding-like beta-propeller repeat protein [Acidobacteriota bacterium]